MEGDDNEPELRPNDAEPSATVPTAPSLSPPPPPAPELPADAAPTPTMNTDLIVEAVALLSEELGIKATIDDRVMRLVDPVPGMPHLAVIQALGFASKAGPVGAAAHGPGGVAAAVWDGQRLLISRWIGATRWVSAYKFPARARPDDYLREDTGIPSHMNKGSWYGPVPDEVAEAFFSVGLLLDDPPFPVPKPPPPTPRPEAKAAAAPRERASRTPSAPREPRAVRPKPPPIVKKAAPPTTRTCAMCNLQKHVSQFIAGSDDCVDCR